MQGRRGRIQRLADPVFTGSVALLALNDHVLKDRFSNWWTGKLSDLAGVVMMAILVWVVCGRTRVMCVVVAGAFLALKTIPGVAELAAPVLGGVTRRDATDLIALTALLPLAAYLEGRRPSVANLAQLLLLPLAIGSSVVATTATSCVPSSDGVQNAVAVDGSLYIDVADHGRAAGSQRSDDLGESFVAVSAPPSATHTSRTACLDDGTCFEVDSDRLITRIDADGSRHREYGYTEQAGDRLSLDPTSCDRGDRFGSIARLDEAADATYLFVSMGDQGLLRRETDGTWRHLAVGEFSPTETGTSRPFDSENDVTIREKWMIVTYVACAMGLVALLLLRLRHPRRRALIAAGMFALAMLGLTVVLGLSTYFGDGDGIDHRVFALFALLLFLVSLWAALRQRPQPPPGEFVPDR